MTYKSLFVRLGGFRSLWIRSTSRVEKRRSDGSLPVAIDGAFATPPQSGLTWFCFLFPLIEPDRRISRIRLSEKTHTELSRHVTPSATSEHNCGVARLIVNPRVLCCFLHLSLTEVPSLHRHYPASSVLRTSPPPQAAQPVSHEVPVDRQDDHRWGFPCCYWSTLPTCRRHYPGRSDGTRSLVLSHQRRPAHITRGEGSCVNRFEACSAFTSRYGLHARQVAYATLYTGGSDGFVAFTAAPIATGWSEPVPGREFHPLKSSAF